MITNKAIESLMKEVIIERLSDDVKLPVKATMLSGGYDIYAHKIKLSYDGSNKVTVFTGLKMKPDPGYMIRLGPRSSITKTNWILQNSPGLGDPDYDGEYELRFAYIGPDVKSAVFPYSEGDRVGQMWLEEIIPINFVEGKITKTTDRSGGFGSTGK